MVPTAGGSRRRPASWKMSPFLIEERYKHNLYDEVSQAFALFLPVNFAHLPFEFLEEVSRRIINEVQGTSRVAYDISSRPHAAIEWE